MKSQQINCPKCGHKLYVKVTRPAGEDFEHTWRRKHCANCGLRVSTIEFTSSRSDQEVQL